MTLAIMLQGTASDVGKSVLVAGLCRIFIRTGSAPRRLNRRIWRLIPVSRRMAKMGRAQIFQAEAAAFPDVRMNPVLLSQPATAKRRWC